MKRQYLYLALAAFASLALMTACTESETPDGNVGETDDIDCGDGVFSALNGGSCTITETGFLTCPDAAPHQYEAGDYIVCSSRENLEDSDVIAIIEGATGQNPCSEDYTDSDVCECVQGAQMTQDSCGCLCTGGGPDVQCPDPNDPDVEYIADSPEDCALADFQCEDGQDAFNSECGCGCIGEPTNDTCPDPNDPDVNYIGESVGECAAITFQCDMDQDTFNDDCGCGCIDQDDENNRGDDCDTDDDCTEEGHYCNPDKGECVTHGFCTVASDCDLPGNAWDHDLCVGTAGCEDNACTWDCGGEECPDPDDPRVGYVGNSAEECTMIDFLCDENHEVFSNECGCGCIAPETRACPDPDDPRVNYIAMDQAQCPDFQCEEGHDSFFSAECGCGCIAPEAIDCSDYMGAEFDIIGRDANECAVIDFGCDTGWEGFDGGECGCGCRRIARDDDCHAEASCDEICFAPGQDNCGACFDPVSQGATPCQDDSACGQDEVCDLASRQYGSCLCSGDENVCQPACTDFDDCREGEFCGDSGHCEMMLCDVDQPCPDGFFCEPDALVNRCVRQTCTTNEDCGNAFCVNGSCHNDAGSCQLPAP